MSTLPDCTAWTRSAVVSVLNCRCASGSLPKIANAI